MSATTLAQSERRTVRRGAVVRSRGNDAREDIDRQTLQQRARQLLRTPIDFIPNDSFALESDDQLEQVDAKAASEAARDQQVPRDLPGHLARLCDSKLLTAEEEPRLFRQMNYLKYRADALRSQLDPDDPQPDLMLAVEDCLKKAEATRDRIVKANMRLVMSIVKKFVTPQHSFDEMLSDGIFSLIQAAEKFDYDRGFRFSTYAYRAIARNAFRRIADRQKENARFVAGSEEAVFDTLDERHSSAVNDEAWDRLRGALTQMMEHLDRRERFIIRSRYALGAHRKVRTFQYLADKLGVSKERVRQLEQRAVGKLQSFAAEREMDEVVGPAFS